MSPESTGTHMMWHTQEAKSYKIEMPQPFGGVDDELRALASWGDNANFQKRHAIWSFRHWARIMGEGTQGVCTAVSRLTLPLVNPYTKIYGVLTLLLESAVVAVGFGDVVGQEAAFQRLRAVESLLGSLNPRKPRVAAVCLAGVSLVGDLYRL